MRGCVTRGSRNIAFAMNTDDVVIWFTVGEDPRSPSLSAVRGDYITPTAERSVAPIGPVKGDPDDEVIWVTELF